MHLGIRLNFPRRRTGFQLGFGRLCDAAAATSSDASSSGRRWVVVVIASSSESPSPLGLDRLIVIEFIVFFVIGVIISIRSAIRDGLAIIVILIVVVVIDIFLISIGIHTGKFGSGTVRIPHRPQRRIHHRIGGTIAIGGGSVRKGIISQPPTEAIAAASSPQRRRRRRRRRRRTRRPIPPHPGQFSNGRTQKDLLLGTETGCLPRCGGHHDVFGFVGGVIGSGAGVAWGLDGGGGGERVVSPGGGGWS